jgi:hypothetical protein
MPLPGAPIGFVCNAHREHDESITDCMCASCVRRERPGLIVGAPFQVHKKFDVSHLVGLYDASVVNGVPVPESAALCCWKDPDDEGTCDDVAEWNVWHETLGTSNPDGVVLQVCSDHLVDVLSGEGRNVVWSEPSAQAYLMAQREKAEADGED